MDKGDFDHTAEVQRSLLEAGEDPSTFVEPTDESLDEVALADTVVLSACETGPGQSAGGEGLLGLQRAFPVASPMMKPLDVYPVH